MPFSRKIYSLYLFLSVFALSCKEKAGGRPEVFVEANTVSDTCGPAEFYSKVKLLSSVRADSLYNNLFIKLNDPSHALLMSAHSDWYTQLSTSKHSKALLAKTRGFLANYTREYDAATLCFDSSVNLYQTLNFPSEKAEACFGRGLNFYSKGDYAKALNNYYQSLSIYEELKDADNTHKVKTEMAMIFFYQHDIAKAICVAKENELFYASRKDTAMLAQNKSILSTFYHALKDYKSAMEYANTALSLRRISNDKIGIGESLNNISAFYIDQKQWPEAIKSFTEALKIVMEIDHRQIPIVKQNLAMCLWKSGNKEQSSKMFEEAMEEAKSPGQNQSLTFIYRTIAGLYKEDKNFEQSLDYYIKYSRLNDSNYNHEKGKLIQELSIKYETAKKEATIKQLNDQKKIDSITKIIYLFALVFTVLTAGFIVFYLRNRNKEQQLLREKAEQELTGNNKELKRFTDNIRGKTKLIEELEEKLLVAEHQAAKSSAVESKEINEDQLSKLYQFKILTEDDWREFKILFDKVYPGIINKLRARYPDLAPAEERQFLLIRLNIENKECADMLGISIESVRKNRYRLKKRFNLQENENLDNFVKGFE